MLVLFGLIQACYGAFTTYNPYRSKSSERFYGLSSLFISGDFSPNDYTYTVEIGTEDCRILSISEEELECLIPPWDTNDPSSPTLKVKLDGTTIFSKTLTYIGDNSVLVTANTADVVQGSEIGFLNLMGQDVSGADCWIGDKFMTTNPQGGNVANGYPHFKVSVEGTEHGTQALDMEVNSIPADLLWIDEQYTTEGERYNLRTTATIESISPNEGSFLGGSEITISGKSFVDEIDRIKVEIEGTECQVTSASSSKITCITGDSDSSLSSTFFEGGAGADLYYLDSQSPVQRPSINLELNPSMPGFFEGFLKLPRSGDYTFYLIGGQRSRFYLNNDVELTTTELLDCSGDTFMKAYFHDRTCAVSISQVVANKNYYFKVAFDTIGSDANLNLGIEVQGESGKVYRNRMPLVKKMQLSLVHSTQPFVYKGYKKTISSPLPERSKRYGVSCMANLGAQYYNIHTYMDDKFLYAIMPSYMYESSDDLKFNLKGGGEDPGTVVKEPSDSQFWFSMPTEFLRTIRTAPQLRVWIDERLAVCKGDCSFTYLPPLVENFSQDSGKFTFTGSELPEDRNLLKVSVGPNDCEIVENSDTSIVCQLDTYEQGEFKVKVELKNYGEIQFKEGTNQYATLTCPDNCKLCRLPTECVECLSDWNLYKSKCAKVCPTGFKCSESFYESQGSDTVFEFKPQGIEKVVVDPYSSIPVKAGTGDQFYPFFGENDPYPAKGRGYYFRGSSYMRLPPYESVSSPRLVFAEEFTVEAWFKPENFQATILSKASNQTKVEIGLEDRVYLTIDGITYYSSKTLNSNWNLAMVTVSSVSSSRRLQEEGISEIFCQTEFEDIEEGFNFAIGANATLQSFFQGFIWAIKVYKTPKITPESSSNCQGCGICPSELTECLPDCGISEFWSGKECGQCLDNCVSGCTNNSTCSLCGNELCTNCNFEACTKCVQNAVINSNETCECKQGYSSEYGLCTRGEFYAELYSSSDNSVTLEFSEPLNSELQTTDYELYLEKSSVELYYTAKKVSRSKYSFELEFTQSVPSGEVLFLSFNETSEIVSESNFLLSTETLEVKLSEYEAPDPESVKEAKSFGQLVAGFVITLASLGSVFNGNPAVLWGILNGLDILIYISLSSNPLTPELRAFYQGLDVVEVFVPNLLEFVFDPSVSPNTNPIFEDFGFESTLFLLNIGRELTIFCFVLLMWPVIWILSKVKIAFIRRKSRSFLEEYQYNVFLRNWIQFYIDLASASLIQVSNKPSSEEAVVFNYCLSIAFGLLVLASPLALFIFNIKNKTKITSEDRNFYQNWGALFYEYRCGENFLVSYTYLVFLLKRLLFGLSLVLLGEYPNFQQGLNLALVCGYAGFVIILKPFKKSFEQIGTVIAEVNVCLLFAGCYYFLQDSWRTYDQEIGSSLIYFSMGIVVLQALTGVFPLTVRIVKWFKSKIGKSNVAVQPATETATLSVFSRNQPEEQKEDTIMDIIHIESKKPNTPQSCKSFEGNSPSSDQ